MLKSVHDLELHFILDTEKALKIKYIKNLASYWMALSNLSANREV